jgi:hypothetical protein
MTVQTALDLGAVLAQWPSAPGRELASSLFRVVATLCKGKGSVQQHPDLEEFVDSFHAVFVLKALHMSSALVSLYDAYADVLQVNDTFPSGWLVRLTNQFLTCTPLAEQETEWMTWLLHLLEMHGKDEEGFAHGEDPRVIKLALEILHRYTTKLPPLLYRDMPHTRDPSPVRYPKAQWLERLKETKDAALTSPGFPSLLCLIRQTTDRAVVMTALKLLQMLLADGTIQHTLLNNKVAHSTPIFTEHRLTCAFIGLCP